MGLLSTKAENQPLIDCASTHSVETHSSIVHPNIEVESFEIRPNLINLLQKECKFSGVPNEKYEYSLVNLLK